MEKKITKKKNGESFPSVEALLQHPSAECLQRAFLILKYATESTKSLFETFQQRSDFRREKARSKRGATTDEEQDILRAMVVFAAAGLDSLLKQIVRDALPELLERNESSQKELLKFAQRAVRGATGKGEEQQEWIETDYSFLAKVLVAKSPRNAIIESLINDLIGESLQSTNQIFKVVRCLGLDEKKLALDSDRRQLNGIFRCRNQIVHEMDIDFEQPRRNRFTRQRDDMKKYAEIVLKLSAKILNAVDKQFSSTPATTG